MSETGISTESSIAFVFLLVFWHYCQIFMSGKMSDHYAMPDLNYVIFQNFYYFLLSRLGIHDTTCTFNFW